MVATNRVKIFHSNPGLVIIILSLLINILVLPLYKRADAMQEEERNMQARLRKGVEHIKKTFKGDERMMMLQTYYRQNNYKPVYVLRSSVSLLLQIPFFVAAYRFLSNLQLLNGASFGPIADLSKPDGILVIAGVSINLLPIIMTVINLISCLVFTKGDSLKSQIQLYAMALFFLIFLYSSPSGLAFYWTLNNVFSLVKTIIYKFKDAKIFAFVKSKIHFKFQFADKIADKKVFFCGCLFLSVLTGILIPSSVIKASPQEFVDITYFYNPLWYITSSFCLAFGTFIIWGSVFYWLAKPSVRYYFDKMILLLSGIALVNYMFFGKNLGILSSNLVYEDDLEFSKLLQLFNIFILLIISVVLFLIHRYWRKVVSEILVVGALSLGAMSTINITNINTSINSIKEQAISDDESVEMPNFTLSKTGKNVIVLMLDRAMGLYIPYLFNEKPELKEQFSGFIHYSNVISFSGYTNMGSPALFGGYEYSPFEINKRSDETLASKQNEALRVMPVLFDQNNYKVTVCDPPYSNYQWIPDLTIYDDYPRIKGYITEGRFSNSLVKKQYIQDSSRNFFCYSILKSAPLCFQKTIYAYGTYNSTHEMVQKRNSLFTSVGIDGKWLQMYDVLTNLPSITKISNENQNTFLMMDNNTTHNPLLLQEPEYAPAQQVNNIEYEKEHQDRYTLNGRTLKMDEQRQVIHYQTNMAAMLQLGEWFDYMRENDVYDNTRIILVSDHGRDLNHLDELLLDDGTDVCLFYPLLMFKDFNSEGFKISEDFMTNADVPTLATKDIIANPVNPFTGSQLSSNEKTAHDQYIIASREWNIEINNGNTFLPAKWYSVHDNIWDKNNWCLLDNEGTLPITE